MSYGKSNKTNNSTANRNKLVSLFYSVVFAASIVIAKNRLRTNRKTNHNTHDDGKSFHCDSQSCDWNIRTIFTDCTIFKKNIIAGSHSDNHSHLSNKAGNTKPRNFRNIIKTLFPQENTEFYILHSSGKIIKIQYSICNLTQNRSKSRSLNTPVENKNKNWIQNKIDYSTCKQADHIKTRTTISTNNT